MRISLNILFCLSIRTTHLVYISELRFSVKNILKGRRITENAKKKKKRKSRKIIHT